MHAEFIAGSDHPAGTCRHCGAPLMRAIVSMKDNRVDDVCSVGWNADYEPFAFPCGAPCGEHQDPRYVLTDLGRRELALAWIAEHGPTVAATLATPAVAA